MFTIFCIFFNLKIMHLKRKYKEEYEYKKPLRLMKICVGASKVMIVFTLIYIIVVAVVNIVGAVIIL